MTTPFDTMTDKEIADEIRNAAAKLRADTSLTAIINTCAKMIIVSSMEINSTTTTISFENVTDNGLPIGDWLVIAARTDKAGSNWPWIDIVPGCELPEHEINRNRGDEGVSVAVLLLPHEDDEPVIGWYNFHDGKWSYDRRSGFFHTEYAVAWTPIPKWGE